MNIQLQNVDSNRCSFTSYHQPLKKLNGKFVSISNTSICRDDIVCGSMISSPWSHFVNFLAEKYKNAPKVNVYSIAASNCAEPNSLVMNLFEKLGVKQSKKFLPIIASDIDAEILKLPMQGKARVSDADIDNLVENIGLNYQKYLKLDNDFKSIKDYNDTLEVCEGEFSPDLRNAVAIRQMDAKKAVEQISGDNNVVMARNFWPYLEESYRNELADSLFEKLSDNNSILIIGAFDCRDSQVMKMFKDKGFVSCGADNWLVPSSSKNNLLANPEFLQANFIPNKK